jgi:hypothetical protein
VNDAINHPKHYTSSASGHECIEFAERLNFNCGNAFKYAWRAFDKHENCVEDLKKCAWYLRREMEKGKASERLAIGIDLDILNHQNTGKLCFDIFIGRLGRALERVLGMIEQEEAFLPDRQP